MIIGIAGQKRSGKDTLAGFIKDSYLNTTEPEIISFATPLKNLVCDILSMDKRHTEGHLKEVIVRTVLPTLDHVRASIKQHLGVCYEDYAINIHYYLSNQCNECGNTVVVSYRKAMQYIGTDIFRAAEPNIWLNILGSKLVDGRRYIIPDVRFENEAAFVRARGHMVHVVRGGTKKDTHISEAGLPVLPCDLQVENNVGLAKLKAEAARVLCQLITGGENSGK